MHIKLPIQWQVTYRFTKRRWENFNRKALYLMVKTHGFPVKIFQWKPTRYDTNMWGIHWGTESRIGTLRCGIPKAEEADRMGTVGQPPVVVCLGRPDLVGGLEHEWIIFHFIYGMSSKTHGRTHIFQDGFSNHQPVSFRRKTSYVPTHPVQLICVYQYHEVLAPSDMLKLPDDPLSKTFDHKVCICNLTFPCSLVRLNT